MSLETYLSENYPPAYEPFFFSIVGIKSAVRNKDHIASDLSHRCIMVIAVSLDDATETAHRCAMLGFPEIEGYTQWSVSGDELRRYYPSGEELALCIEDTS